MAQPHSLVEYLGAIDIIKDKIYRTEDIKAEYATANMLKIKTAGVKVGIDGTTLFPVSFDDETLLPEEDTVYIFDKNCIIVVGRYVNLPD